MTHCNRRGAAPADCGENGLVGCAGELPTFCRPARPRARPVSRAAAYGATLPLRRRRAAETRDQAPSPAPPTLHRARRARPVSGPSFGASDPAPRCSAPSAGPPVHRSGLAARAGSRMPPHRAAAPRSASAPMTRQELHPRTHCTNWRKLVLVIKYLELLLTIFSQQTHQPSGKLAGFGDSHEFVFRERHYTTEARYPTSLNW